MGFQTGTGELANRIRRALGMRGRVDLAVDETAVPTILVMDSTRAPYRRTGRRWFASAAEFTPTATQIAVFQIHNELPNTVLVIDQLMCGVASGDWVAGFYSPGGTATKIMNAQGTERYDPLGVSPPLSVLNHPVVLSSRSHNGGAAGIVPVANRMLRGQDMSYFRDLDLVIPQNPDYATTLTSSDGDVFAVFAATADVVLGPITVGGWLFDDPLVQTSPREGQ